MTVNQNIQAVSLLVHDYDEAIAFYTQKLLFRLIEDTPLNDDGKRWVLIAPPGESACRLLLAQADGDSQRQAVGNQAGGRVFLFLHTDDFWRDHELMLKQGVKFTESPRQEAYGTVAVFQDLYGNLWDLIQSK